MTEIALATALFVALILAFSLLVLAARGILIPQQSVALTVNGNLRVAASTGTTLLDALTGAGIALPAACGGKGTCGLCRVTLPGSDAPVLPTEAGRLSPADLRAAVRLACQVRVRGALSVTVDPALLDVQTFDCEVVSTRVLTPTIKEIVLAVPSDWPLRLRPGDFVLIGAPAFRLPLADIDMAPLPAPDWSRAGLVAQTVKAVTRAYSVANRPQDEGRIVLDIRLALPPPARAGTPPGVVSSWLLARRVGDRVRASGPFGEFHLQPGTAEIVFVGGGVGMAPLRAMVHAALCEGTDRRMSYYYGARSAVDLIYAGEFEDLASAHANFTWVPVLSEVDHNERWDGERGFVHELLVRRHLDVHPDPDACEYYLCGPPLMTAAVLAALDEAGVDRSRIFNDDFGG